MRDAPDPDMTRRAVFARLPRDLARELRIEAARREVPMSRLLEEAIERFLADAPEVRR